MKKIQTRITFLFFISIFLFNSSTLLGMKIPTIKLESLQQKDFTGAALDCGYFAIYNAVQMVQAKNELDLTKSLVDKKAFKDNYNSWQIGTFLSANQIDIILNKLDRKIKDSIYVVGDPTIFDTIKQYLTSQDPQRLQTLQQTLINFGYNKISDLVEKFCTNGSGFAFIIPIKLKTILHWITLGVRNKTGGPILYITNSMHTQGFYVSKQEVEDHVKATLALEEQKGALPPGYEQQLRAAAMESFKEFEQEKANVEEQITEDSEILAKFIQLMQEQKSRLQAEEQARLKRDAEEKAKELVRKQQEDELRQEEIKRKAEEERLKQKLEAEAEKKRLEQERIRKKEDLRRQAEKEATEEKERAMELARKLKEDEEQRKAEQAKLKPKELANINGTSVTLVQADITKQFQKSNGETPSEQDAIVNAANKSLLGGGGVDGAIHKAASFQRPNVIINGREVDALAGLCYKMYPTGCPTREARITEGLALAPVKIIHAVGPQGENPDLLKQTYSNILKLAQQNGIKRIAIPPISTGIFGYPIKKAVPVAFGAIRDFLNNNPPKLFNEVRFSVITDKNSTGPDVYKVYDDEKASLNPTPPTSASETKSPTAKQPPISFPAPRQRILTEQNRQQQELAKREAEKQRLERERQQRLEAETRKRDEEARQKLLAEQQRQEELKRQEAKLRLEQERIRQAEEKASEELARKLQAEKVERLRLEKLQRKAKEEQTQRQKEEELRRQQQELRRREEQRKAEQARLKREAEERAQEEELRRQEELQKKEQKVEEKKPSEKIILTDKERKDLATNLKDAEKYLKSNKSGTAKISYDKVIKLLTTKSIDTSSLKGATLDNVNKIKKLIK